MDNHTYHYQRDIQETVWFLEKEHDLFNGNKNLDTIEINELEHQQTSQLAILMEYILVKKKR